MAETNQYTVNHKELLELLIKDINLHEGKWQLIFNLNIGTGSMGPTPDQSYPGVMVTIPNVGIQRVPVDVPEVPGSIVVDAAKVNPKKK